MARSTCEGEGEKGDIGNETGMGDREEEIREGLGKEDVDVRLVWLVWLVLDYGVEIWDWKERVKVEAIEEIYEMGIGNGREKTCMERLQRLGEGETRS